jgi:diguanylate cyclase (GGDEF)-like protein/PAS domain S-box-containing protein
MDKLSFLQDYVDHIEQSFIISKTDTKGIITYANDLFCKISGYSREELIGQPHNIVRHPSVSPKVFKKLWDTIEAKKTFTGVIKNRDKQGNTYTTEIKVFPIVVDDEIIEYVSVRTDITDFAIKKEKAVAIANENFKNEQVKLLELSKKAYKDPLTGVGNRLKFNEMAKLELANVKAFDIPLAIAVIDIDHFKKFNDTYGHLIGDEVLIMVANHINEHIRDTDIFARWGGEEFVILFKGTVVSRAKKVADKLRESISTLKHDVAGSITASFGLTQYYEDDTLESLFHRCDEALYKAKENGRNRVEVKCDNC